jgi:hypothetical protein
VRRTAIAVGAPRYNNDTDGMLRNIFEFVRFRMTYVPDPDGFEFVTAPDVLLAGILQNGTAYGDCDDHVLLFNTMIMTIGFTTKFAAVKLSPGDPYFNHVISSVLIDGVWKDYDPCAKFKPQPFYQSRFYGSQLDSPYQL